MLIHTFPHPLRPIEATGFLGGGDLQGALELKRFRVHQEEGVTTPSPALTPPGAPRTLVSSVGVDLQEGKVLEPRVPVNISGRVQTHTLPHPLPPLGTEATGCLSGGDPKGGRVLALLTLLTLLFHSHLVNECKTLIKQSYPPS